MRNIKYKVKYEDMISRLPALFPYIEDNELGINILHSATDAPMGCYGKIVENIILPKTYSINGIELESGVSYSYRTLMNYYYQYKDTLGRDDEFIKFIDRAIGYVKVEGIDFDKHPGCPEYIYLASAKQMYNKMIKMKRKCEFYEARKDIDGKNGDLCCICDKFDKLGGDVFINFLNGKINEAKSIAEEYKGYAAPEEENKMKINMNLFLCSSDNDLGLVTPYIEEYQLGKWYYKNDVVAKSTNSVWEIYNCNTETCGEWDETYKTLKFPENCFDLQKSEWENIEEDGYYITGKCESKLASLRRNVDYLNVYDEVETPDKNTDWLFYYRKGYVANYRVLKDELGNVLTIDGEYAQTTGEVMTNLYAYGDVISDIERDTAEHTIKITYYLDAHLKAELKDIKIDDDGNKLYLLGSFKLDTDSENGKFKGVKYVDTYNYAKDGEIDKLTDHEFAVYVEGGMDFGSNDYDPYGKYEMTAYNHKFKYSKRISYLDIEVDAIYTEFETFVSKERDVQDVKLFRNDYYQGISYAPNEEIDVNIDRGITSAFDKHIRFSEINSIEDMETMQNGSFFVVKQS